MRNLSETADEMATTCDILVVGAGIAGASAAYELAKGAKVIVLERESHPGYHTTGRSAALFTELYGNETIRKLTSAGREFFESPPGYFGEYPLTSPRGTLFLARDDQLASVRNAIPSEKTKSCNVVEVDGAGARRLIPALRSENVVAGVYEPSARDIDVNAVHMGYIAGLRLRKGSLEFNAEVAAIERANGIWNVYSSAGSFEAPVLVNAAGAWCDEIASLAGVPKRGLVPKRRTAFVFDPPADASVENWPAAIDIDEQFYFKPDAGLLLGSPADETPSPPCDAQPEEIDVATGIYRIEQAAKFSIRRPKRTWAGLRTFAADKSPIVGMDPWASGFFWLAGQGGYGIQTSPALARAASGLVLEQSLPRDLVARGLSQSELAPDRLALKPTKE
ncbi:MAG: FAD-binding oxidoreductase [Albidovulum sp.]|nr:FAD-binding oxidoreductase [Albidovulum sp.]MDE0529934.1 FAD-binding oxidoreductase [Albidovulum sp.]